VPTSPRSQAMYQKSSNREAIHSPPLGGDFLGSGTPYETEAPDNEFVVDGARLDAPGSGLAYRRSQNISDVDKSLVAPWGSKVSGKVVGDWLKTPHGYLPFKIQGTLVLGHAEPAIVGSVSGRTWWGFPSYVKYLDTGLQSWNELARLHGHLGNTCNWVNALRQCGTALICREGICGECELSRDCMEKSLCQHFPRSGRKMCVRRDLAEQWTYREVILTMLIIITAMLSAAAGMGGGGVYVPLLLLMLEFSTKEAVPLSQAMIVGGATVNIIMFSGDRHPKFPQRPKIDYDVVMMLNPGLAAGVTVGVMLNVISPQWIIVLVLVVTLVLALQKSLTKGIASFRKESQILAEQRAQMLALTTQSGADGGYGSSSGSAGCPMKPAAKPQGGLFSKKLVDVDSFLLLANDNQTQMSLIFCCWAVFLLGNVFKAPQCSTMYWLQLIGLLMVCVAFTAAGARVITRRMDSKEDSSEGVLAWTPTTLWWYPMLSTVAGFLGGFLGIGGGIIMGPLLLELGMAAEASQATTAMFVFLSSSLASIQFVVLGKAMPQYALWFTVWVILATVVGQTIIDYALKMWQRTSLIVLSVAAIIAGSLVMMTAIGAKDTATDFMRGAPMGFAPMNLCTG